MGRWRINPIFHLVGGVTIDAPGGDDGLLLPAKAKFADAAPDKRMAAQVAIFTYLMVLSFFRSPSVARHIDPLPACSAEEVGSLRRRVGQTKTPLLLLINARMAAYQRC